MIKLGEFKSDQKYFTRWIRKSWKPHKIIATFRKSVLQICDSSDQVISRKTLFDRYFYMKMVVTIIRTDLVTNLFLSSFFFLSHKLKTRVKFSASWWSGNEKYFSFLFIAIRALLQSQMPNSIDFYKGISLHVIPVRLIAPWYSIARYDYLGGIRNLQFVFSNTFLIVSHPEYN